ncbi:MAG: glycosyltransferase [Mariniphaga sp.]
MTNRQRILVVSNNIPRPDKSSGELRFVSILELLLEHWDLDFCVANSHIHWNNTEQQIPYIEKLENKGIRVVRPTREAFSNAVRENHYAGGYFNLYWIAEEMMPLFKMAQPGAFTIVDSVDVHFAREETQVKFGTMEMSQVLQTKHRELSVYKSADLTIAVSKDDFNLLTLKEGLQNVFIIPNVVKEYQRIRKKRDPVVVFVGCYAWYPNPEAVKWFAEMIWPIIFNAVPTAEFLVIGSDPTPEILALDKVPGIRVLGYVPETKPFLEKAAVSVAPMLVGGGMKGKVNEAMAHGVPVVATSIGAQGFDIINGKHMMVTDNPTKFAEYVISLLENENLQWEIGIAGQKFNSNICSQSAIKEKVKMLVDRFAYQKPFKRTQFILNRIAIYKIQVSLFIRDLGYAVKLLKREGSREFITRSWLYVKGQRLPSQNPLLKAKIIQEKPNKILKFPPICRNPLVSIIIPVYNQWDFTYACLHSILKNSIGISYEIILADDNSTDNTKNARKLVKNINVIRNVKNLGFLFNCNNAAKLANGKYIILLNNDTIVQPDWLKWLLKTMEERPEVGYVGSKLVFSTGKLQEAGGIVFIDGSAMNYGREDDPDRPQYNYFKDVDYCTGAAICVRKSLWDQLRGFDPQYAPAYYEDTDFAMQIRAMGFRTVYQPKAMVIHFEGISHGTDITQGIKKKQEDNQTIFHNKWKDELCKNNYLRDENIFKARDKSKYKQTIVLFDYTVPVAKNQGEKTLEMIKHYIDSGFNVKFLPTDFQRPEPAVSELEQQGVEILYGLYYSENWLLWIIENTGNLDSICFMDEFLANKYLPTLKSVLSENFPFITYTRNIETDYKMVEQLKELRAELNEYKKNMLFPAGHFYSTIVDVEDAKKRQDEIWKKIIPETLPGIELNVYDQLRLVSEFSITCKDIPFPNQKTDKFRYFYENPLFSYSDGLFLYCFIKQFNPSRIIEIGSGYTSALILDTIQFLGRHQTGVSFVEPYADRLYSLISDQDKQRVSIFEQNLQQIELSFFEQLGENDILFIDSTHVSKTGSDVNYLLFEILPSLKKGVLIHFHDIFYPFEYPKDWVFGGRSWNEAYILRSFLMYNNDFKILLFPDYLYKLHRECFSSMLDCYENRGGSFWLQKIA